MTSVPLTEPSLTLVRRIKAPPRTVFAAFVEPTHIMKWWGPDAGPTLAAETDVRVGGRFRVMFETLDGERHENRGEYLEIEPPVRLVMAWWWAATPERRSRVTVSIRPISDGSELTIQHEMLFDVATRDNHLWGWNGTLDKLERVLGELHATPPQPTTRESTP
jgi:uncharacterized protein YndB with AHSA1/START domain